MAFNQFCSFYAQKIKSEKNSQTPMGSAAPLSIRHLAPLLLLYY